MNGDEAWARLAPEFVGDPMLLWGAIWGLILGFLWPGHDSEVQAVVGAILGVVAGFSLRRVVRTEIAAQRASWGTQQGAPSVAAAPEAPTNASEVHAPETPEEVLLPGTIGRTVRGEPVPMEPQPVVAASATETLGAEAAESAAPPPPRQPGLLELAFARARAWLFGGNTIVRAGVLVLFIGLAFLAKFAADNALLPPELRLAGIALAGIALFGGGFRLRARKPDRLMYALTLQGAGVAVLYLTVFAAFRLYAFLPSGAAFAMLGLICAFAAVIALAQNAMVMAFIGFAGGFAAPILVSTGQDNHVGLFTYYLLLDVAIVAIAWARAWRPLNLLGFFATFGVATAWGALKYQPEKLASTEPFLIAFFLLFVAASLLYALRHALAARRAVDGTLVFGTPLLAFGLQVALVRSIDYAPAFSSLALGAFYLALTWALLWRSRRVGDGRGSSGEAARWLAECFVALGLGFVTLAVPLALDGRWTSAVWAVEGAGVFWLGQRQGRWRARAAGLVLQLLGAIAYLDGLGHGPDPRWPLANPVFLGALLLAGSAFAIAFWLRDPPAVSEPPPHAALLRLERALSPVLFWVGFLWWQFGLGQEITRAPLDTQGVAQYVFSEGMQAHLLMLGWVGSAFVLHHLALVTRARPWPIAATPAWFALPVMVLAALQGMLELGHALQAGGWLAWPLAVLLHGLMLRHLDGGTPQAWWRFVHAGGVWLLVLLLGNGLVFAIGKSDLWQTAWASVILLVAGMLVLLLLARRAWFDAVRAGSARWPLDRFARAYLWVAAAPLALCVALGCLLVALLSDGNARPLPYVPLLNPTDLSIALGLAACALWLLRLRGSSLVLPLAARHPRLLWVLMAIAFVGINTVWLRMAHHYAGVPWDAGRLFDSFLVQAGYSILWTLLALGLMVFSHRRLLRAGWMLGAVLLAATVFKLFLIDLSNRGGSERIFVFIAVGVLMLVVGYFAPIPPAAAAASEPEPGEAQA